jgi:hypothetical protein
MSTQQFLRILALSAVAVALSSTTVGAATESASGAPAGFVGGPSASAPSLPVGLDDTLRRISESAAANTAATSEVCDPAVPEVSEPRFIACWEYLSAIAPQARADASIEIEPLAADVTRDLPVALEIAALWNSGRHAESIDALRQFEDAGARVAVGVSWAAGAAPTVLREGPDVRLGAPDTGAHHVDIDYDATTGNVFSVVGWGSTTGEATWDNHISTDHGSTFTRAYEWFTVSGLTEVDAAVVDEWLYVGYLTGEATNQMRVRRCSVADGTVDAGYGYRIALDAGAHSFTDLAVVTNADDFDNRLYCLAVQDDHALLLAWATSEGLSFTNIAPPAAANVAYGMSATWSNGFACTPYLFVSYLGTGGDIHVLLRDLSTWTDTIIASSVGPNRDTSISAYGANVICAYEATTPNGTGIKYAISYDCGSAWGYATLAEPNGVTTFSFGSPAVDARNGRGTAIVYYCEEGEPDSVFYQSRAGFMPGPWTDPAEFNDFDVLTGTELALNPLSPTSAHFDLGAIYIASGYIPFFDQPSVNFGAVPDVAANTTALRLLPASPNPFRSQTTLRFELAAPGRARMELFDLLGRHVATLLDEDLQAGAHEVSLAGRGLKTGLYLYRLTSGGEVGRGRLVLIP